MYQFSASPYYEEIVSRLMWAKDLYPYGEMHIEEVKEDRQ